MARPGPRPGPHPATGHGPVVAPSIPGLDLALFQEFPDPSAHHPLIWRGEDGQLYQASDSNPFAYYPNLHGIYYGEPGVKKSTFAATFPKPQVVFLFDPPDKAIPYYRWGRVVPCDDPFYETIRQASGAELPVRDVLHPETGELLIRVEEYGDEDPWKPTGFTAFEWRIADFSGEAPQWGSVVVDSLTYCMYASFLMQQNVLNPNTKQPMQWYGGVRTDVESMVRARFTRWKTNVALIAHTGTKTVEGPDGSGQLLRFINAVGQLGQNMPSGYGEYYHIVSRQGPDGKLLYMAQTAHDGKWMASSGINAPNPCPLQYLALWRNWGA